MLRMLGPLMIAVTAGLISYDCNCIMGNTCNVSDVMIVMAVVGAPITILYIAINKYASTQISLLHN